MFGYVVVNKPELKIKDFDVYQAFYCGLCRSLHKQFGRFGQVSLNYDLTFLAILLSGLYEPQNETIEERCIVHPLSKHQKVGNPYIDYAAEMTIVLTYLKCSDDWNDDHHYQSRMMMGMLAHKYERVKEKYPKKIENITNALTKINACEEQKDYDLDKLSSLFGIVMGEILAYKNDEWNTLLYETGDYLGRYIYIMDAFDDIEEDVKNGAFNPFIEEYKHENFNTRVKTILEIMISKSADAFEMLPILQYADILRNIIYSGVWAKYEMIRKQRLGEQHE
ncbi:MAG: DUF5685 family protein [Longicatena sp.]